MMALVPVPMMASGTRTDDGVFAGTDDGVCAGAHDGVRAGADDGVCAGTDDGVGTGTDDRVITGADDRVWATGCRADAPGSQTVRRATAAGCDRNRQCRTILEPFPFITVIPFYISMRSRSGAII